MGGAQRLRLILSVRDWHVGHKKKKIPVVIVLVFGHAGNAFCGAPVFSAVAAGKQPQTTQETTARRLPPCAPPPGRARRPPCCAESRALRLELHSCTASHQAITCSRHRKAGLYGRPQWPPGSDACEGARRRRYLPPGLAFFSTCHHFFQQIASETRLHGAPHCSTVAVFLQKPRTTN
eukprot:COSAG04_NODE_707_length_10916_cov_5.167052_6_plen_178_part_00